MGKSVDWLDVYTNMGADEVRGAILHALSGPSVVPPANPHPKDDDHHQQGDTHAPPHDPHSPHDEDRPAGVPPRELILPSQAGPRGMLVLERLFGADVDGEGSGGEPCGGGGCYRLRRFGGKWYVYAPARVGLPRWKEVDDEVLRARVRELLEGYWTRREVKGGIPDEHGREWKYTRFAPTDRIVGDIMLSFVHRVTVRAESVPAWLPVDVRADGVRVEDPDRWQRDHVDDGPIAPAKVIAFRNGLLDVDALVAGRVRLIPHSARWFAQSTLDTDLPVEDLQRIIDDKEAGGDDLVMERWLGERCPAALQFLHDITGGDDDKYEALQRLVGYYMTPDTSLDVIGGVVGLPGSGKGTLAELVEAVVGSENVASMDLDRLADKFGVASLVGKTMAVIPEMHVGRHTNVASALQRLKSISGGDPQFVEDKHIKGKARVKMTVKFLLTPNEWPRLPDASAALVRRLVMIPVYHKPEKPDPTLGERMCAERAAVRVWALLGLRRLWLAVREGRAAFPTSAESREMLREVAHSASPMLQYIDEECVASEGNSCTTDCLFAHHVAWRKSQGYSGELAKQTFGQQLMAAGGYRKSEARVDGKRTKIYEGIRPRLPGDEQYDGRVVKLVREFVGPYEDGGMVVDGVVVFEGAPRTPHREGNDE